MTTTVHRPASPDEVMATIRFWIRRGLASARRYEEAKRAFADVTAAYVERYGDTYVAECKAAADVRRQNAIADAQWYATEVSVAADTIAILRAAVGGER